MATLFKTFFQANHEHSTIPFSFQKMLFCGKYVFSVFLLVYCFWFADVAARSSSLFFETSSLVFLLTSKTYVTLSWTHSSKRTMAYMEEFLRSSNTALVQRNALLAFSVHIDRGKPIVSMHLNPKKNLGIHVLIFVFTFPLLRRSDSQVKL